APPRRRSSCLLPIPMSAPTSTRWRSGACSRTCTSWCARAAPPRPPAASRLLRRPHPPHHAERVDVGARVVGAPEHFGADSGGGVVESVEIRGVDFEIGHDFVPR